MDSRERVRLAFAHREPDRVPLFELTIDNPTASYVLGRPALCGFGGRVRGALQNEALLAGRIEEFRTRWLSDEIELWRRLGLDVYPHAHPVPCEPAVPERLNETSWRFTDPATGQYSLFVWAPESDMYDEVDSSIRQGGLDEFERLTTTLEDNPLRLEDYDFSPLTRLKRELDCAVMGEADVEIGSTFCWAETFLVGLVEAPGLIHRYLDARLRNTLRLLEAVLELGVDGVQGGCDWAANHGPMFSPRHFQEFVFPRLRQITDLCHRYGVPYVKHTDGNIMPLLDGMIDAGVDAFQAIEPRAGMDITRLKRDFGDRLTLIGNVDCSTVLVHGPEDAVRAQTRAVIRNAAPGGGFLLSSSNSIHPGVKPEYYLAMLDTARREGSYPLRA